MKNQIICYYGCIDKKYSRNKTNIDGLRLAGVDVREVIVNTPVTPLNAADHVSPVALIKRVLHKFTIIPAILKQRKDIKESDVIFVGYPGQFDVPMAYLVAKLFGKKLVFDPVILMFNALSNDIGVIQDNGFITRLLKGFEKVVMNLPDMIIASTIEQKCFFMDKAGVPEGKIAVAYLAADDQMYHPGKTKSADDTFRVVYYGLFTPLHGVPHIIEAARLTRENKDIVYQMVGKGQLYTESRQKADELQLKNIEFYPDMREENAMGLLQQADVFLGFMETNSTILREIPNKVYQGMALGKTVVTGDSPAIRSVFKDHENIYLVPAGNGKALSEAILDLFSHRPLAKKIATNALATFKKNYTVKAIGEVLKSEIQRLSV